MKKNTWSLIRLVRELKSHEQKIVLEGQKIIQDKVKAEMHQAVVEVGTDICTDINEAFQDVSTLRKTISQIAADQGLWVGASGTHPFSHWESQLITDHARYNEIVNELQEAARSNLIFGLHVHVGMESREMANHIANSTRYFLPHIYALSTNSPFWEGRSTVINLSAQKYLINFPAPVFPNTLKVLRPTKIMSSCWLKPIALTMQKKYGGIFAYILSLIPSSSEFAMYP